MNRFMYSITRKISNERNIKSLYPKCINCINFRNDKQICVKFVNPNMTNYVDDKINYEYAANARNDNTNCGESGKFFEHNYLDLAKKNDTNFSVFFFSGCLSGLTSMLTNDISIFLVPFSVCFMHGLIFCLTYNEIENKIKHDNERIQKLSELTEDKQI